MNLKHPATIRPFALLLLLAPLATSGGVATDGSLGPALELAGPEFVVGESLGTRAGTNLFHSFHHFGIAAGESALFTGATDIENVVSRVTGGDTSIIDGLLRSDIGGAAFWFFNPAGVIFGPNAALDLPAALHIGTGDYLGFSDGSMFPADPAQGSTLAIGTPGSFGFLQGNRATIRLQGSELLLGGDTLSLDAHTIEMEQAVVLNQDGAVQMRADPTDGAIRLTGSAVTTGGEQAGEILLRGGEITLQESLIFDYNTGDEDAAASVSLIGRDLLLSGSVVGTASGGAGSGSRLQIEASGGLLVGDGSRIQVAGAAAGAVGELEVRAGSLQLAGPGSGIASYRWSGDGEAGGMEIEVGGTLVLGGGTEIASDTYGEGAGGDLTLTAGDAVIGDPIDGRAWITSDAKAGGGDAGTLQVAVAGGLQVLNGSYISSDVHSEGNANAVVVSAGTLVIDGGGFEGYTGISSDALEGSGSAGLVQVTVTGDMAILGGAVSSDTYTDGDAGAVEISADRLLVSGGGGEAYISSDTVGGDGDAGTVQVTAGDLVVESGAYISSDTYGAGDAGALLVEAGTLSLDGSAGYVKISSDSRADAEGMAGGVVVVVTGEMTILNGNVSSDTYTDADAGVVWIEADRLEVRGGVENSYISSDTLGGAGDAGALGVVVRELVVGGGGYISSDTYGAGDAGMLYVEAETLQMEGGEGHAQISSDALEGSSGAAGTVAVLVTGHADLRDGAYISSDTYGSGAAGGVDLIAETLTVDGAGYGAGISSGTYGTEEGTPGNAGLVRVLVHGDLRLLNGGWIETGSEGGGDAGDIELYADTLWIEGSAGASGISSESEGGGDAGGIALAVGGGIVLLDNARITTTTDGGGDAGGIGIAATDLWVEGGGEDSEIASKSINGGGAGGWIEIALGGSLVLIKGAEISSSTDGDAVGGWVQVEAANIHLEGLGGNASIATDAEGAGDAGAVELTAHGDLTLLPGGFISSDTYASGAGGGVAIRAGNLYILGDDGAVAAISADSVEGSGNAGYVVIQVDGETLLGNRGYISSDTYGTGRAGDISLATGSLSVEGDAGISSAAYGTTGDAGWIDVIAREGIDLRDGGFISTSTFSAGDAGELVIRAGRLLIDGGEGYLTTGVASVSEGGEGVTTGAVGSLLILADRIVIRRGGEISIESTGTTAGGTGEEFIAIEGGEVRLSDHARITAAAEGETPAANIFIYSRDRTIVEDQSSITTASEEADGGVIGVGGGLLYLERSQITTSVSGESGNGGDILLETDGLVLNRGFIQANTAAAGASGGNILVASPYLVVPANQLFIAGGNERLGFDPDGDINVIQAAAPDGINGQIELEVPDLGLSASIVAVDARYSRIQEIGANPCALKKGEVPSSLTVRGLGGGMRPEGVPGVGEIEGPCDRTEGVQE